VVPITVAVVDHSMDTHVTVTLTSASKDHVSLTLVMKLY
jgi:hypothetical protein